MKPGDVVKLKHLKRAKDESGNWSSEDKLTLDTEYVIEEVYGFGWVKLKDKDLGHSGSKFIVVNGIDNTILFYC